MLDVPLTLSEPAPRTLGARDQAALWGSLGVTLTIPAAAVFVVRPFGTEPMPLIGALVAIIVGVTLGSLVLGAAAVPGAATGQPAMVLLRGLFGRGGSLFPTALNIAQCVGWTAVEILVIANAAAAVVGGPTALWIVLATVVATAMALRPMGSVRVLRKYAMWAVLFATVYLFVGVLREGLTRTSEGSWSGFWLAVDVAIALPVSWAPLIADYSRHSKTTRKSFIGTFAGYAVAGIIYFALGALALFTSIGRDQVGDPYAFSQALLAIPLGAIALVVLIVDEVDEAFANIYSTVASLQNLRAGWNRKRLAVVVGMLALLLALVVDVVGYESFLFLIGSVFVPLFAVVIVDWFVISRGQWNLSDSSKMRWSALMAWLIGFATYQLINPGSAPVWSNAWIALQKSLGFVPPVWLSASIASFAAAAITTMLFHVRRLKKVKR